MTNLPIIANKRPHDYFNVDDEISIWLIFQDGEKEPGWYHGNVRIGYRHHDGCVSYRLSGVGPQDGDADESPTLLNMSGFWGCGYQSPTVMKKKTFEFFQRNPHLYGTWCKESYERIDISIAIIPGTEAFLAKDLLENA